MAAPIWRADTVIGTPDPTALHLEFKAVANGSASDRKLQVCYALASSERELVNMSERVVLQCTQPDPSPYLFIKRLGGILTEGNRAVSRLMREEDQVTIWLS